MRAPPRSPGRDRDADAGVADPDLLAGIADDDAVADRGKALREFPGRVPGRTLGSAQALRRGEPAHERAVGIADPESAADLWIGLAAFVL